MKRIVILLVLVLPAFSFKAEDPCLGSLKECLGKMAAVSKPQNGKSCYMHMNVRKDMDSKSKVPDSDVEVKITISEKVMLYETNAITIYKDEQDAFTIIHARKQIIWTEGTKPSYNEEQVKQIGTLQQKAVEKCSVQSCQKVDYKSREASRLTLVPPADYQKGSKLKEMTFIYDGKEKKIEQIGMKYLPGSELKEEVTTFHEINFNYKGSVPAKVKGLVLNTSGKVLARYKGYALVDQR